MVKSRTLKRTECLVCIVDIPPGEFEERQFCVAAARDSIPREFSEAELLVEVFRRREGRAMRRAGLCVLSPAPSAQHVRRLPKLPVHQAAADCRRGTAIYRKLLGEATNLVLVHNGVPIADRLVWNEAGVAVEATRLQHLAVARGWNCAALRTVPEGIGARRCAYHARRPAGRPARRFATTLLLVSAVVLAELGLALRRPDFPDAEEHREPQIPAATSIGDSGSPPPTDGASSCLGDQLVAVARALPQDLVVERLSYADGAFVLSGIASNINSLYATQQDVTQQVDAVVDVIRLSSVDRTGEVRVDVSVRSWP